MGLSIALTTTNEPVSLDEVKRQLRLVDNSYEDAELSGLITDARTHVELYLRRQLMPATITLNMDRFPYLTVLDPLNQANPKFDNANYYYGSPDRFAIWIPRPPLVSVTSITYIDMNGTQQTLSSSVYNVDTAGEPGRIAPVYGQFWPGTLIQPNAVIVTYQAGYADAAHVPSPIKRAIKRLINIWWNETGQNEVEDMPKGIRALLYPYRNLDERVLEYA